MATTTPSIPKWRENVRKVLRGTITGVERSTSPAIDSLLEMALGMIILVFTLAVSEYVQSFPAQDVIIYLFAIGIIIFTVRRVVQRFDEHYTVDEIGIKAATITDEVEVISARLEGIEQSLTEIYHLIPDPAEETEVTDERIASVTS